MRKKKTTRMNTSGELQDGSKDPRVIVDDSCPPDQSSREGFVDMPPNWQDVPGPSRVGDSPNSVGNTGSGGKENVEGEPWPPPVPPAENVPGAVIDFIYSMECSMREWCKKIDDKVDRNTKVLEHVWKEVLVLQADVRAHTSPPPPPPGFGGGPSDQPANPTAKRGRGRPRKNPAGPAGIVGGPSEQPLSPTAKRGRGRPRKKPRRGGIGGDAAAGPDV